VPSRKRYDDDRPIRRRTRRAKPGSALPWVLAAVGGLVLVCGGVGVLLFFTAFWPKFDVARRAAQDNRQAEAVAKVSRIKLNQLRAGMTKAEVEAVLGPGRVADNSDVFFAAGRFDDGGDTERRWKGATELGRVSIWDEGTDRILVAFSHDPNAGGAVVGILGSIDSTRTFSEPVRLAAPPPRR
jgi:hypothetical protein